jgi:hypothetical protein
MAAEKSRRAGAIVMALPHLEKTEDKTRLLEELRGYYPHARFFWDKQGLRISFYAGSIRLPAAVMHAAYYVEQEVGPGRVSILKGTLSNEGKPIPAPPKTVWERLGEDFD